MYDFIYLFTIYFLKYFSFYLVIVMFYATWSHKNTCFCALSVRDRFTYLTARTACFKEKEVKYVNPGTFLLRRYRYILLCFYYVATETYCGGSEFKYPGTVAKSECSIVLEIFLKPNPTLNLPDSVNKYKTDIKTYLLMQQYHFYFLICRFELLCRTVITQDSNRSSSPLKYVSVLRELPNKLTVHENT